MKLLFQRVVNPFVLSKLDEDLPDLPPRW